MGRTLIAFDNTYARLPSRFYAKLPPAPVAQPKLIKVNRPLAAELNIDSNYLESDDGVSALAGNRLFDGSEPLAMAYAGHQFGNWVHQLGDGRALLLGEVVDANGCRRDIQLKGSGRTPFSRNGDGRAWLGPVLREYVVSEAIHALGIPSTRALAAVETGERVFRDGVLPGAVLTRIATSHIRVGTFQYFYARNDIEALELLTEHVASKVCPDALDMDNRALALLCFVVRAQARLIALWMGLGFIHGVMNTDNMSLAGETIDFGPCAFMDNYEAHKVFSSIDRGGRYAYSNQPSVGLWNLAQFATTLVPLINDDKAVAVEKATEAVNEFRDIYNSEWLAVFGKKFGFSTQFDGDADIIAEFLNLMAGAGADFTLAFRQLARSGPELERPEDLRSLFRDAHGLDDWLDAWRKRTGSEPRSSDEIRETMLAANPAFIPRNHRIEQLIAAAVGGDFSLFENMNEVLASPYSDQPERAEYMNPPEAHELVTRTFCGT